MLESLSLFLYLFQTQNNKNSDQLWRNKAHKQLNLKLYLLCVLSRYLWQLAEVALADVSTDAVVGVRHVLADEGEGVSRGQQREQLVLLRLVVQDLGLWFSVGQR